ncbi:MAG: hypothetical protein DRJ49_05740 [Thermoprotei archaeon]|nr:MAG: hypothetical protein DRN53_01010 [Thermoprotei archaeon]RLE87923.1 MAG: hypothetical protein DRJ49_05740 [Thermoprotei archaeon]
MRDKIKTGIMVDRELGEEFKSKVGNKRGLRYLSRAVKEAIENEISDIPIIRALEKLLKREKRDPTNNLFCQA